jgi:hypothetical protein
MVAVGYHLRQGQKAPLIDLLGTLDRTELAAVQVCDSFRALDRLPADSELSCGSGMATVRLAPGMERMPNLGICRIVIFPLGEC